MIAERSNYRQQLENQLTQDSIFVMLITHANYLPFSRIFNLDYRSVSRSLNTLKSHLRSSPPRTQLFRTSRFRSREPCLPKLNSW